MPEAGEPEKPKGTSEGSGSASWAGFAITLLPYLGKATPFLAVAICFGGALWVLGDENKKKLALADERLESAHRQTTEAQQRAVATYESIQDISKKSLDNLESAFALKEKLEEAAKLADVELRKKEQAAAAERITELETKAAAAQAEIAALNKAATSAGVKAIADPQALVALRDELTLVVRVAKQDSKLTQDERERAQKILDREFGGASAEVLADRLSRLAAPEATAATRDSELSGLQFTDEEFRKAAQQKTGFAAWVREVRDSADVVYWGARPRKDDGTFDITQIVSGNGVIRYVIGYERACLLHLPSDFDPSLDQHALVVQDPVRSGTRRASLYPIVRDDAPAANAKASLEAVVRDVFGSKVELISPKDVEVAALSVSAFLAIADAELLAWIATDEAAGEPVGELLRQEQRKAKLGREDLMTAAGANFRDPELARWFIEAGVAIGKGNRDDLSRLCADGFWKGALQQAQRGILTSDFVVREVVMQQEGPTKKQSPADKEQRAAMPAQRARIVTEHGQRAWRTRPSITLVWDVEAAPGGKWLLRDVSVRDYSAKGS